LQGQGSWILQAKRWRVGPAEGRGIVVILATLRSSYSHFKFPGSKRLLGFPARIREAVVGGVEVTWWRYDTEKSCFVASRLPRHVTEPHSIQSKAQDCGAEPDEDDGPCRAMAGQKRAPNG